MHSMFYKCTNLAKIDLSNFDTSNVTNMYRTFSECKALTELNLTSFDTSKVTSLGKMFENSSNLKLLRVKSAFLANMPLENMNLIFNQIDNLRILSPTGTFSSELENLVRNDYSGKVVFYLEIEANNTLVCNQDTYPSFDNRAGILFGNNSVLDNATTISCPTEEDQWFYFALADGATSATIKNRLMIQLDEEVNEDIDNTYTITPVGRLVGNYKKITEDNEQTTAISTIGEIHVGDLNELTENDTVFFVIHTDGEESIDRDRVVVEYDSDYPVEITANFSNDIDKDGYDIATNLEFQGDFKFFGNQSGFVNGEVTASGANIEFVGDKSMFKTPFTLINDSIVRIREAVIYKHDITVDNGSKLIFDKAFILASGTLTLG